MTTSSSISVKPARLGIRDTEDLLDGGDPRLHFRPPVFAQRHEALRPRNVAQRAERLLPQQAVLDLARHDEQLEESGPPPVAGLPACRTALATLERHLSHRVLGEERHALRLRPIPLPAVRAD